MLFFYFLGVYGDCLEIRTSEFDELIVNDKVIKSSELVGFDNVKISHPGTSIFKFIKTKKKTFKLVDITRYIDKKYERNIRIDYEVKYKDWLRGQEKLTCILTLLALSFLFFFKNIFGVFKV
ncbi:hypothetical protein NBO_8g0008 [Nosema bombycis CQ1]|uniref:Uncharacterized protein n=1 Tax=Nosema bombycis (strain CQ1 / CVCC 102059) TaxID=578461 RepID=R0MQH6_NOSB1|nr:hypothetical protein NBO_8g0008 [Nosema bombycis CQ1]|eukprot:EOB15143.1 hypothetical protein NBO_8g0008 [Nosema bombycis CQ1]